ncbi:hypothetical protein ACNH6C_18250 [Bdellovibrio bacteriovorus]|uniref:hypothetical protein n=1 Tax=Bdellovibrio bacteriovorus TaxID=959 RepID=UPI003A808BF8
MSLFVPAVRYFKTPEALAEMNSHYTESFPLNMAMSYQSAKTELKNYTDISLKESKQEIPQELQVSSRDSK